ncbi:hypothetical protein J4231_03655 [Candidatus Woesearchaeota archaeon]|nr:hypothetical protein [Candidatus Woesearchaeota archaeon]
MTERKETGVFYFMKTKIKPIMPSLKEKKRYVSYRIISDKQMNENIVNNGVKSYVMKFLGELSYARAGIIFLGQNENSGIIRTSHNYVDEVKSALALIESIDNNPVNVFSTNVSGALNKAKSKMEVN